MKGLIYCYIKKDTNKIVYVGQTTNESYRRYRHEKYDPFSEGIVEYDYPLSRGIRKYGLEAYEYKILENNIDEKDLIAKEEYYINLYDTYNNGYNQTPGGIAPKYISFSKETIELAKQMLKEQKSYIEINHATCISFEHISEINTGKRHHDSSEKYPLNPMTCGRKFTDSQIDEIYELLRDTKLSQEKIGKMYNVTQSTIGNINRGDRYKREGVEYPIRKIRCDSRL